MMQAPAQLNQRAAAVTRARRHIQWLGVLMLLAPLAACQVVRPDASATRSDAQARIADRLYFGRSIPGGGMVSDEEWSKFLAEFVTPRFPAGLTVWHAEGQWREATGHIAQEPTIVIELIHERDAASETAIQEIVKEYRTRFRQEAVMRTSDRIEVSF
jgi:Protein of unknown function (DUF3574)